MRPIFFAQLVLGRLSCQKPRLTSGVNRGVAQGRRATAEIEGARRPSFAKPAEGTFISRPRREIKVARHSTALRERRYRCYLPVLAEFTRLLMHGTWPARTMGGKRRGATYI